MFYLCFQSTVCQKIMEQLGQAEVSLSQRKVVTVAQDAFYKQLSPEESKKAAKGQYDFDHPSEKNTGSSKLV